MHYMSYSDDWCSVHIITSSPDLTRHKVHSGTYPGAGPPAQVHAALCHLLYWSVRITCSAADSAVCPVWHCDRVMCVTMPRLLVTNTTGTLLDMWCLPQSHSPTPAQQRVSVFQKAQQWWVLRSIKPQLWYDMCPVTKTKSFNINHMWLREWHDLKPSQNKFYSASVIWLCLNNWGGIMTQLLFSCL